LISTELVVVFMVNSVVMEAQEPLAKVTPEPSDQRREAAVAAVQQGAVPVVMVAAALHLQ
jgi:hypothetical protein